MREISKKPHSRVTLQEPWRYRASSIRTSQIPPQYAKVPRSVFSHAGDYTPLPVPPQAPACRRNPVRLTQKGVPQGSIPLEMAEEPKGRPPSSDAFSEGEGKSDNEALSALYDEYAAQLYAYGRALGAAPSLAEDVIQEVFVKLAGRLSLGGRVANPRAYLFTAARNEFYRWSTRLLRRSEVIASGSKGFLQSVAPGASPEEVTAVEEALVALPRRQREVVMMKIYGGLTFREIAVATGTSINTAAGRYRGGMKRLKDILGGE